MPKMGTARIESKPPENGKKVVNIYVNEDGKLVIEYEEEEA